MNGEKYDEGKGLGKKYKKSFHLRKRINAVTKSVVGGRKGKKIRGINGKNKQSVMGSREKKNTHTGCWQVEGEREKKREIARERKLKNDWN